MNNIYAAVDGSKEGLKAAQLAAELARASRAKLTLVFVRVPIAYPAAWGWFPSVQVEQALAQESDRILKQAEDTVRGQGLEIAARALDGNAAHTIADAAVADGADLIVVGSHGQGAISRLLLGSVADRLLHISKVPVLVAR